MKKIIFICFIFLFIACEEEEITSLEVTRNIQTFCKAQIQAKCFSNGIYRDSILFFIAECSPEEKYIYMYNDSLQPTCSFGEKGRLFSEFNMPFFYRNSQLHKQDSIIQIYDINLLQEKYMNLNLINRKLDFIDGRYFPPQLYFSENLNQIDNNTLVGNSIETQNGIFFIYKYDSDSITWIKYNTGFNFKNPQIQYDVHKNIICANPSKRVLYAGYRFLDLIQLYDVDGKLLKKIQFSKLKKPLLEKRYTGVSYDNPIYTIDMYATSRYCYLLRANMTMEQLNDDKDHPCQIIVMDWEGNIKDVLQIPFFIMPIVIDENNTTLFSIISNHKDPENAYLVKINI
jgi:lipoprotein